MKKEIKNEEKVNKEERRVDKNHKNRLTELVIILDESGSMHRLKEDTIGGFNDLLDKQRKLKGDCNVTTVLFNTKVHTLYEHKDINKVPYLSNDEYRPGGCTALLDAIGQTITSMSEYVESLKDEKSPKVIVAILTDGLENSSVEYDRVTVKSMIEDKKKEGWEFLFLGANIDAIKEAGSIGIQRDRAVNFEASSQGTRHSFNVVCKAFSMAREDKDIDISSKK